MCLRLRLVLAFDLRRNAIGDCNSNKPKTKTKAETKTQTQTEKLQTANGLFVEKSALVALLPFACDLPVCALLLCFAESFVRCLQHFLRLAFRLRLAFCVCFSSFAVCFLQLVLLLAFAFAVVAVAVAVCRSQIAMQNAKRKRKNRCARQ